MRVRTILCAAVVMVLTLSNQVKAEALAISYVGTLYDSTEVTSWRTSSVTKSLDIDGNSVYGSMAAVNWQDGSTGENPAAGPGWHYVSSGGPYRNSGYADIDPITSGTDAGIALGGFTFTLTGTDADYAGKTIRVGVMAGVIGGECATNYGFTYKLVSASDATVYAQTTTDSTKTANTSPDMVFFDITGATAGAQFSILASGGTGNPHLGAVSWDIASVPEPSSLTLLSAGLVGLFAYVWRKRR